MENAMVIKVRDVEFIASFAENSSAQALKELLKDEPLTIDMSDYWWVSWHRIQRWQRRKSMSGLWEARIFRR